MNRFAKWDRSTSAPRLLPSPPDHEDDESPATCAHALFPTVEEFNATVWVLTKENDDVGEMIVFHRDAGQCLLLSLYVVVAAHPLVSIYSY